MPAPTPIQVRYGGDPSALGGLALAAGTARRRNADYQSQLANDRAFLQNELSRRTEDTRYRNNANLSLLSMQANERAARAQATALQEASGFRQRQTAQAGGVAAPIARSGSPITLVPEEGPIDGTRGGGGQITFPSAEGEPPNMYFSEGGEITRFDNRELSRGELGGSVRPGQQQRMIPADRRSAMEEIKLAQSWMPPAQWNALWTAVQGGALDPSDVSKTISSIRTGGGSSGGRSPEEGVVRGARTTAAKMRAIEGMRNPEQRDAAMMDFLGFNPGSLDYRRNEPKVNEMWGARKARVGAYLGADGDIPNAASLGVVLGSSSSSPVDVSETWEADNLPTGTFFRVPDGRIFQAK